MTQPIHTLLHSSKSNEWYTPSKYIEAARAVMGGIDLDPASNAEVNHTIQAARIFTAQSDGLVQAWRCADGSPARVWLNPPYGKTRGKSNQKVWTQKLVWEYERGHLAQAIMLVNAATDTRWFEPLWLHTICFVNHRIQFLSPAGKKTQPTHASVFVYLGQHADRFRAVFGQFGNVVQV